MRSEVLSTGVNVDGWPWFWIALHFLYHTRRAHLDQHHILMTSVPSTTVGFEYRMDVQGPLSAVGRQPLLKTSRGSFSERNGVRICLQKLKLSGVSPVYERKLGMVWYGVRLCFQKLKLSGFIDANRCKYWLNTHWKAPMHRSDLKLSAKNVNIKFLQGIAEKL